jgi:hypothetical protein
VIFGEFEIDISKVFRHFRLPLIWIFVWKEPPLPQLQQNFIFFLGAGGELLKFVHPNSSPTVPLVKKALQLCTKILFRLTVRIECRVSSVGIVTWLRDKRTWELGFDSLAVLRDFGFLQILQN